LIPVRGKNILSVPPSCDIGSGSQWVLVALFPKLRRPGRGADHITVCRGFKNVCGAIPLPAWHAHRQLYI